MGGTRTAAEHHTAYRAAPTAKRYRSQMSTVLGLRNLDELLNVKSPLTGAFCVPDRAPDAAPEMKTRQSKTRSMNLLAI